MAKITVHPGGFIKRNYIDELGLTATELADALEVSESTLSRLIHEKIDLSPALAVKVSKVLGRSAESWMAMQASHTLARYQAELEQWTPTKQVTADGGLASSAPGCLHPRQSHTETVSRVGIQSLFRLPPPPYSFVGF
jgi:addiction module HigA family antidote